MCMQYTLHSFFPPLFFFSGLIGQFWAMIFASGGYKVSLYDIDEKQVTRALSLIQDKLKSYEQQGSLRGTTSASEQFQLISGHTDLAQCLQGASYIQVEITILCYIQCIFIITKAG